MPRFYRWLHRTYARGHGWNHFLRRRIRPAGLGLLALLVVSGILGAGSRLDGGPQVFSLTLCLLGVGLVWAACRRARLEAVRQLPRYVTAGEKTTYWIAVKNLRRRSLKDAWLVETKPDPRPDLEVFYHSREPGERRRNAFDRLFVAHRWQWLLARNQAYEGGKAAAGLAVDAGATARVPVTLRPARRGLIPLNDLRVLLPDPIGLFQRCRQVAAPPAVLTVLPRRYRLPAMDWPGSARFQMGGEAASNAVGHSGDFFGLRDYRPGDPLRQIHWRSWARQGRPIVKELEENFFPRYGLVLDTFPAAGDGVLFEEAVSVAASLAADLDTRESLLDLMFIRDKAHVFTAGRGTAKAEKMLEVLAAVTADPHEDFAGLARLVLRHREDLTACLCVLAGWSPERAEFVRALSRGGLDLAVFVICDDREEARRQVAADRPPVSPHLLRAAEMQRDLLALPMRL